MSNPRVTDNDHGEITVSLGGRELRGWSYKDDAERRVKMLLAREYIEGWCDSAAPQMLAALKATRLYVEILEKHLDPVVDPGAPTIREHAAMVRDAITKADGANT